MVSSSTIAEFESTLYRTRIQRAGISVFRLFSVWWRPKCWDLRITWTGIPIPTLSRIDCRWCQNLLRRLSAYFCFRVPPAVLALVSSSGVGRGREIQVAFLNER